MDPFEKPYWSKLQVELWVCTRSRAAVSLAEYSPGRTLLVEDESDPPDFDDEDELIYTAIIRHGTVCSFEVAKKAVIVALADGRLQAYSDPANPHEQFFERMQVLKVWRDQHEDPANNEPSSGEQQQPDASAVDALRSGAPGRPTSMHLVEAELNRRIAAGKSWPTKTAGADELRKWLQHEYPDAPRPTAKTIKNKLGHKILKTSARN